MLIITSIHFDPSLLKREIFRTKNESVLENSHVSVIYVWGSKQEGMTHDAGIAVANLDISRGIILSIEVRGSVDPTNPAGLQTEIQIISLT